MIKNRESHYQALKQSLGFRKIKEGNLIYVAEHSPFTRECLLSTT